MSIVLVGSTSGSVTLQEPAVAGTTVLDLPAVSGTVITTGSPQSGSVLQVVNANYGTQVINNTNTYADTGLTATITPKFSTSKILVLVTQSCKKLAGNTGSGVNIKLFRNSTDLGLRVFVQGYTNTSLEFYSMAAFQFLDSPSTTSATTYKTQFNNDINAAGAAVQADNAGVSTITLMEIAA
jgi:hypothetical protein